jgi:predicted AAA+ superfamily ATPase
MKTEISRELYLKKIRPFYHSELIKVITGVRRSGKSTILRQIRSELVSGGVPEDHIIEMNFELVEYGSVDNYVKFHDHVSQRVSGNGKYYMFFDEIQKVTDFEKAINSFRVEFDCNIFITGSNGKLLSGELATLLTGRYVEFRVMPFTFREVAEYYDNSGDLELFGEYMRLGGMPMRLTMGATEARTYLRDLKASIIGNDIQKRHNITNTDLLNRIVDFMLNNSSNVFSANSVANYLLNEKRNVSTETVYNYVEAILSSLLISKVRRFDVKGKELMKMQEKYYAADTGIWYSDKLTGDIDIGACLETIVYNELIARGYSVSIGKIGDKEVDFVAEKDGGRAYIQVSYLLADSATMEREFSALELIPDNYPKYVLSMVGFNMSRNGIVHLNLLNFLLSDDSLVRQ